MKKSPDALLILRVRVQNANAISSPLTWGFPAPTAFVGFVHALHRSVHELGEFDDLTVDGVGIVCHRIEPQVAQPAGRRHKVLSLTRNPLTKEGRTAAIVEEGRVHLELSLVIGLHGLYALENCEGESAARLAARLHDLIGAMRLAGGSIFPAANPRHRVPRVLPWPAGNPDGARKMTITLRRQLLPGFVLVDRTPLLAERVKEMQLTNPEANALDALFDLAGITWEYQADPDHPERRQWKIREKKGWLVPLPLGYSALGKLHPPGSVKGARDASVYFRFVESVVGLGQWLSPHRVENLESLLWFHHAEIEYGQYRCIQALA